MTSGTAAMRLTALIAALPDESTKDIPAKAIVADLVALLPKTSGFVVRSPDNVLAAVGSQQARVRMALGALAIGFAIAFALSASFSPAPGNGAKSSAPAASASDGTTVLPHERNP
ncbi:MAG: hypothetical protein ABSC22_16080 [Roseiarcus sp.]|jgi:hypothetical protein